MSMLVSGYALRALLCGMSMIQRTEGD